MLQQNWYNDGNRYFKWILDNISKVFVTFDVLFVCFALFKLISFNAAVIIFSLFYIIALMINNNKLKREQTKKPLVITKRIKRLYVTLMILYLIATIPILCDFVDTRIYGYYIYIGLLVYFNYFIFIRI